MLKIEYKAVVRVTNPRWRTLVAVVDNIVPLPRMIILYSIYTFGGHLVYCPAGIRIDFVCSSTAYDNFIFDLYIRWPFSMLSCRNQD
jgi:hypothetical protein